MAFSRVRPVSALRVLPLASAFVAALTLISGGVAHAGKNDLRLLNLCDAQQVPTLGQNMMGMPTGGSECKWVNRNPMTGEGTGPIAVPADAQSMFRSLMSELGVAIAPRMMTPADTLGYAGFQFSAELGVTKINADRPFWRGVEGSSPNFAAPTLARPDSYLTTVGGFVRKGMWLPLPALEFGAGAVNIVGSRMYALQGYAKLALQEGFHGWVLPSVAVRGSASELLGTNQVDLNVFGVDVIASKAFGLAGTVRLEPFVGWNYLWIDAVSGVIDATPACDAVGLHNSAPGKIPEGSLCAAADSGSWHDLDNNFTFAPQDVITRQRWSLGFKLKLAVLFMVAEWDIIPAGTSHDEHEAQARDMSGTQQSYNFSAGFDF
jgi:hypothetical protein